MKNKVLGIFLAYLLIGGSQSAFAACADDLVQAHFSPGQAIALCASLGSAYSGNASISGTLTVADDTIISTTAKGVRSNTSDAADSKNIFVTAGGALNTTGTRGAFAVFNGNEEGTNPGDLTLSAGNVAGGEIYINAPVSSGQAFINADTLNIRNSDGTAFWTKNSTGQLTSKTSFGNDIGWTAVNAANQACNTTCSTGCVFGMNTGALGNFVACTDATADTCICAGGS